MMEFRIKKIAIFGVGLIGGSFALGLKRAGVQVHITGVGRHADTMQTALRLGIIDSVSANVEEALADTDLALIAAPVAQTAGILRSMLPYWHPHLVVTDAGSTKSDVVAAAREVLGDKLAQFVPAHPIAGREQNGPQAALADLYQGKKVVITRLPENSERDVNLVAAMWQQCGALIHHLNPVEHDAVFAAVSHLPHLLAYTLVDEVASKAHAATLFQYAASGFRDFTRIAGSSPEMWRDITLANRAALLAEIDCYTQRLAQLRSALERSDGAAIEASYTHAQQARHHWIQTIEAAEKQQREGGD